MLKKFAIGFGIFITAIYALFLIIPFCLTGLVNSYSDDISKIVEENTGFKLKLEKLQIITTPKLTVGIKAGHIETALQTNDTFLTADNAYGKISLIKLIIKKIQLDSIGADNINLSLKIKKDGKFLIEDYIKTPENNDSPKTMTSLPFGFKLSNKLPDIKINNYNISFIDMTSDDIYSINGNKFHITDFILDKKIKVTANGKITLKNREQFMYDIKLFNKIMPDLDLNTLVFAQNPEITGQPTADQNTIDVNLIDIFKAIYQNQLTANLIADIKTSGTLENHEISGKINASDISVAVDGKPLPSSNVSLDLKGKRIIMFSELYSSKDEVTNLTGDFTTGKHPKIDLNCKSNAQFNSLINIIDSVAKTFGIKDFDTLSATGSIDADFTIKSDLKKLESSGYIKIPSASLFYKLYNASVDKIFADIQLADDTIDIKDAKLTILNQPLKIKGTISSNADADINISANKLQLKGLLLAAGQVALLKENRINSGTVSLDAVIKGKLDKIMPKINVNINDVNIKNVPSDTTISVANSKADLTTNGIKTEGTIGINNIKLVNPMATLKLPVTKITFGQKDIIIDNSYILLNNSKAYVTGKVTNYMTKNINFDIKANGKLLSSDIRSFIPKEYIDEVKAKGSLPVSVTVTGNDKAQDISFSLNANPANYVTLVSVDELNDKNVLIKGDIKISGDTLKFTNTGVSANNKPVAYLKGGISDLYKTQKLNLNISTIENISIVIPYFAKSKMNLGANVDILGTVSNPILKGNVNIPSLKIPEMLLTMNDLQIHLNGVIARGKGTLKKIISGGIEAENLTSDFELTNNIFYLKNMTGDAFKGKIKGDVSYNILNGKIGADIKGEAMDAEKAIAGAAGIKNALSGTLGFDAKVTTSGATDVEMMKNLKGKANFDIQNGKLGNIGRFENFILAKNIMTNTVLKAAAESVTNLSTVKQTAIFKSIDGNLDFSNGWADLKPVKMSGYSMSYYITGKYNLINATANLTILGRISAEVVKLLGPIGDLSVTKLTSYIPVFGTATGNILTAMTTNPEKEKTENIPDLSSGNTNYKDFKVEFNGGVESSTSVKSFKWLSTCDTSGIETVTIQDAIENTQKIIEDKKQQQIDTVNKAIEEQKQQVEDAKKQYQQTKEELQKTKDELKNSAEELKNTAEELKNLFKF